MPAFFINEGTFEVDGDWDDKSVTALTFPSGSQVPEASFTVTREPLSPGGQVSVADYVDEQLSKLARSCQQFDLIRRDDTIVSEQPGQVVEFTWKTPDGAVVRQVQAVLMCDTRVLVLTGTAPKGRFADYSDVFQKMISTFRIRK